MIPTNPPNMAPRVVKSFQYIERISTGKLAEAAIPKVSPIKKAMFIFSNKIPHAIAITPRTTTESRDTTISCFSVALPFLITF